MSTLVSLLARELFLLVLLSAIGAWPAVLAGRRLDGVARMALMPAFGLAVALCVMMTAVWRAPTDKCAWLLIVLAVASVALAARRLRGRRPTWRRALLQPLLVVAVVLGVSDAPLVHLRSVGPVSYGIADAAGYIAVEDGMRTQSEHTAAAAAGVPVTARRDLVESAWQTYASGFQQYGFDTVASSADSLLGLGATQTYSAFVIALLAITALGVIAAVRLIGAARGWAAGLGGVLGGALVAGPFWLQLSIDGSEGAISGLALVLPLTLLGYLAVRDRDRAELLLLALLAAGLQTAYPLFVPPLAVATAVVLAGLAITRRRWGSARRPELTRATLILAGVLVLAAALSPVAFARNVRYWHSVAINPLAYRNANLPVYDLPTGLLPSWLLQTRWLYRLPHMMSLGQLPASILAPLAMIAVIALALWRRLVLLAGAAVIAVAVVLAYATFSSFACTYCEERNLLIASPLALSMFAIGVSLLAASGRAWSRGLAVAAAAIAVLAAAAQVGVGDEYVIQASFAFPPQARAVIARLPSHPAPLSLAMEGFGQAYHAPLEDPAVYAAVRYATGVPPSLPTESDDFSGLAYFGGPSPAGAQFDPAYRYVLTRLAGVDSGRATLYRDGPVALQRRAAALDVLITGGVETASSRVDPRGRAWLQPQLPLALWISGTHTGEPVSVRILAAVTLPAREAVRVLNPHGVRTRRRGRRLSLCADTSGPGAFRRFGVAFSFLPLTQPPPRGQAYGTPPPPEGLRLLSVRAAARSCRGGEAYDWLR